jgi:hypothetical protein
MLAESVCASDYATGADIHICFFCICGRWNNQQISGIVSARVNDFLFGTIIAACSQN